MLEFYKTIIVFLQNNPTFFYSLIFFLLFLENVPWLGLIMPGALALFFSGFIAPLGFFNLWHVFIVAALGSSISDLTFYILGRSKLIKLDDKSYQKQHYIAQTEKFYDKNDEQSIFLARFIGPLRPFAATIAGKHKMNMFDFWFYTIFGSIFWAAFLLSLGYFMATSYDLVRDEADQFGLIVSFLSIITFFLFFRRKLVKKLKRLID